MPLAAREDENRLSYLDALRGLASAWVVASHLGELNGFEHPILLEGSFAVDLFMMLSGFLMVYHYMRRRPSEPWTDQRTICSFWIRRFFRIAPLYYCVLLVSMLVAPVLGGLHADVAAVVQGAATNPLRYSDTSLANIAAHLSFAFGLLPGYAARTPLPDWSIGLEVAYYAFFPLIMLLWARGPARAFVALTALCVVLVHAFPTYFEAYTQPAALPLKFHTFAAGMLLATALLEKAARRRLVLWVLAMSTPLVAAATRLELLETAIVQCAIAIVLSCIVFHAIIERRLPGFERLIALLEGRLFRFLGDTSYGLYLVHLPVAVIVVGLLIGQPYYAGLSVESRIAVSLAIVAPLAYAIAWVLHITIERLGISLGRDAVLCLRSRTQTSATLRAVESEPTRGR